MNLQHIKYAQAVMKYGSINKAAKELFITQPYLSYCIKELEHSFGIKLFNRTSVGSEITDEGKEFLEMTRPLLFNAEQIKEKYSKKIRKSKYVICSTRTAVALKAFETFCKNISSNEHYELSFYETGLVEVIEQVYFNTADIGIILYLTGEEKFVRNYTMDKNLKIIDLDRVPVFITVSKNHEVAGSTRLSGSEMEHFPCVTYSDFMDSVLNIEKECGVIGIEKPMQVIYVRDRHTLLRTLSVTEAYVIGPKFLKEEHELFNLVSIPVQNVNSLICFGCVVRNDASVEKGYNKKRYQRMMIKILRETVEKYLK